MATFWIEKDVLKADDLVPGSIEDSIDKWKVLLRKSRAGCLVQDGGSRTCALCHKYCADDFSDSCGGCPVLMYTGYTGCRHTPYMNYHDAYERGNVEAAESAAEEMVAFLEMLHDEGY